MVSRPRTGRRCRARSSTPSGGQRRASRPACLTRLINSESAASPTGRIARATVPCRRPARRQGSGRLDWCDDAGPRRTRPASPRSGRSRPLVACAASVQSVFTEPELDSAATIGLYAGGRSVARSMTGGAPASSDFQSTNVFRTTRIDCHVSSARNNQFSVRYGP